MPAEWGSLPFEEQIAFFRQKLNIPTARWDDLWQEAHDTGATAGPAGPGRAAKPARPGAPA